MTFLAWREFIETQRQMTHKGPRRPMRVAPEELLDLKS
jgi:hypothetical protein